MVVNYYAAVRTPRDAAQCAQPQWPPRAPHIGADGARSPRLAAPTPTIPGLDRSFARFAPWHAGHDGVRSAVTKASNGFLQSGTGIRKAAWEPFYL